MSRNGNTFGKSFCVTTFGESHGTALGCVIDGCPAGIKLTKEVIQKALDRRRPGASVTGEASASVTARKEADAVEILSGVFNDPLIEGLQSLDDPIRQAGLRLHLFQHEVRQKIQPFFLRLFGIIDLLGDLPQPGGKSLVGDPAL